MKSHNKPFSGGLTLKLKIILFCLFLLLSDPALSQIVHVTSSGAGTMDGSSWANALPGNSLGSSGYTRLADTLRHAVSGTAFWVAEGTYKPATDNDRNKSFEIIQNVSIFGGFGGADTTMALRNIGLHETVFSGNVGVLNDSTDNVKIILKTVVSTAWVNFSQVDGLTVSGAFSSSSGEYGCGLFNSGLMNVINCIFKNNFSNKDGGGIFNGKSIKIINCTFFNNRASNGGGFFSNYSTGPSTISFCRFSNNLASHNGGGICNSGNVMVTNSLIVNNSAMNGGGLYSGSAINYSQVMSKIINTTLANNSGKDIYILRGTNYIWNSIAWGNGIYINTSNPLPTVDIKNTCAPGSVSGSGIINSDPLFMASTEIVGTGANGLSGNWHLRWCSPCFNTGLNSLVLPSDTTDLDGFQRIRYTAVDMGCYELDTTGLNRSPISYVGGIVRIDSGTVFKGNGNSWSQAVAGRLESCRYPGKSMLYEVMKDAPAGTQIWVAKGTYLPGVQNNRNDALTLSPGVRVFGGFSGTETQCEQRNINANPTIFSGNTGNPGTATDNSYHVLNINPEGLVYTDTALIDGIVVEKGNANGSSASGEGGGILVNGGTMLKCHQVHIQHNNSNGNGAGIRIAGTAKVVFESCSVISNQVLLTTANGSGIFNEGKLNLNNCRIANNQNAKQGTGIYNSDTLILKGCAVDSNHSAVTSSGGGLFNSKYCLVINTGFRNNDVTNSGGAIFNNSGANIILDSCIINYNNALNVSSSQGGGICNSGNLTFRGGDISYNSARSDGGGLFNAASATAEILSSTVSFNLASGSLTNTGGGGLCNSGLLSVDRSIVCNNQTTGSGGGIYNPTILKNSIVGNNARGGQFKSGGGIRIAAGCQGIFNSTIVNNLTEGISGETDTTMIFNSIIWGNETSLSGKFKLWNTCIENGFSGISVIQDDPVFINPLTGIGPLFNSLIANWELLCCSPCVNYGNNCFLDPADTADRNGHSRIFEGVVDLGAYEYQLQQPHRIDFSASKVFVDDSTNNAGSGISWSDRLPGNAPSCRYPGYNLLYEAMRDAPSSCSIWLKNGIYFTSLDNDRNKYFLLKPGLKIIGGFSGNESSPENRNIEANPTIISANIGSPDDSTDNAYHVFYSFPVTLALSDTAILDGICIQSGYANYSCYQCLHDDLVGGGLFINDNLKVKITNCTIRNNYGIGNFSTTPATIGKLGGGGIYSKGALWIRNSNLVNNTNFRMGGAVFNTGILDLFRCQIDSNIISYPNGSGYQEWGGAGVYNTSTGSLIVDSCSFTGNQPFNFILAGGGIRNKGEMTISNSSFSNNKQSAVSSETPTSVINCVFNHNENAVISHSLQINHCEVSFNGGGITTSGGESIIQDCQIFNDSIGINSAGKTHIVDCEIHHNNNRGISFTNNGGLLQLTYVKANRNGAGINHTGDSLFVENCNIHHNSGGGGSGITIASGYGYVSRSLITMNIGDAGAAIKNYSNVLVENCLITNNSGWIYGIVCNVENSRTHFSSCTFANNSINTGYSNTTPFRHGTHYNTAGVSHFTFQNCIIQSAFSPLFGYYTNNGGTDSIFYSLTSNPIPGEGNIADIPDFVAPVPMTDTLNTPTPSHYALSACSPCINAGADSLCADSLDLAGNRRKYNTIDMGALELKYDTSVTALWANNIAETRADIHWSRSVKPCETVVFIKDTTTGSPVPLTSTVYNADTVYGNGSNLAGWFCISLGLDSLTGISGLLPSTTYRVAVFNRILDTIYDVPALMNFTTPGTLPPVKIVNSDTISQGETDCFNAGIELVVGGANSPFRIEEGGSVTLISGQKIRLLPGTTVESGGYLHAYIAPNGPWCYETKSTPAIFRTPHPTPHTHFSVSAFPNPVTDLLTVSWTGEEVSQTGTTLVLKNLSGKTVFTQVLSGVDNVTLSLRNLPHGLYFLSVENRSGSEVLKIIR